MSKKIFRCPEAESAYIIEACFWSGVGISIVEDLPIDFYEWWLSVLTSWQISFRRVARSDFKLANHGNVTP